ncbi:MAG: MFS transporter [Alphaproteobacteria bacterium]
MAALGGPGRLTGGRLAAVVCIAEGLSVLGFSTVPALLPTFFDEWNLSNTDAGWMTGVYFAGYMAVVPVLVSLTDRVDPRRIYLIGAVDSILSSLGFALFVDGFWGGLAFRALGGIGLAGTYMPGLKALTDHVPARMRSRVIAFYTASLSIGFALSFLLSGEIEVAFGWRWAFALVALGPVIALFVFQFLVPPSAPHHLDAAPGALLDFRPILRNRAAMGYVLAYGAHNWELFAYRSWIVTFFVFSQGLQVPEAIGIAWSATALAALVSVIALPASVLGNEAAVKFGRRRVLILVMGASALVAVGVGFSAPLPFTVVIAVAILYSVTVSADSASLTAGAVEAALPGQRGATMAVHTFVGFGGGFAGPLAFGVMLDLAGGRDSQLAWGVAFAGLGLVIALGPVFLAVFGRDSKTG